MLSAAPVWVRRLFYPSITSIYLYTVVLLISHTLASSDTFYFRTIEVAGDRGAGEGNRFFKNGFLPPQIIST